MQAAQRRLPRNFAWQHGEFEFVLLFFPSHPPLQAFSPQRVDVLAGSHHVLWMGDLNYRLQMGADETGDPAKNHAKVVDWVGASDWTTLYAHDELQQQIASVGEIRESGVSIHGSQRLSLPQGHAFTGFREGVELISFPPTFKVES